MVTHESRYLLPTDKPEGERLNRQHWWLRKALGDILFAPITLKDGDAVLDSGTGTGCWIIDCHETFKADVEYFGVDISSNLFPTVGDGLASRIHFSQGNILTPEGEWAKASFKLVNQRLLVAALSAEEWKTVIANIYNLLQPGGWVQLVETDHAFSGETTKKHRAVLKRIFEKRGILLSPTYDIPALLDGAGFVSVDTKDHEIPLGKWAGKDGEEGRATCIGVYRGMKHTVVEKLGILSASEYDSLIDNMEEEWDTVRGSRVRYNVFRAQKPE